MNRRSARVAGVIVTAIVAGGCASGGGSDSAAPSVAPIISATTTTNDRPSASPAPTTPSASTTTTATTATTSAPGAVDPGAGEPPARLDVTLDAGQISARLSATHTALTDATASDDERAAAGVEYQLVLRALADRPALDDEVLDSLDPSSRPTIERIVRARQFLQQRNAARPPQPVPDELPAWTIVEPEPIDTLLAHYGEAEQLTGIPWYWLAAIHLQETRMGRIRGVSSADAVGPMQFLPTTWAACCTGDPTVTRDAVIGAATYLAQSGGPDDMAAAVYQYNPNDGYVAVVTAYAENLRDNPELYAGYHAFQVFFGTSAGTVRLPIGYSSSTPVDAAAHLAAHPRDAG